MRAKIGIGLWLLGILALSLFEVNWLQVASFDGEIDLLFALQALPPFVLLVFGTWPIDRWLWLRRSGFYLGLVWWIWLILSAVGGIFNAEFRFASLAWGGAGVILLAMFAPRKSKLLSVRAES